MRARESPEDPASVHCEAEVVLRLPLERRPRLDQQHPLIGGVTGIEVHASAGKVEKGDLDVGGHPFGEPDRKPAAGVDRRPRLRNDQWRWPGNDDYEANQQKRDETCRNQDPHRALH